MRIIQLKLKHKYFELA